MHRHRALDAEHRDLGTEHQASSRPINNSIADVLGFARRTYSGADTYTAPYSYNLHTNKYIIVNIEGLERLDSSSSAIKDAFCVIMLDDNTSNFRMNSDFRDIDNDAYTKYFPEPIPRLDRFRIKLYDIDGNLFNFHGHDHIFVFKISTKNHSEY